MASGAMHAEKGQKNTKVRMDADFARSLFNLCRVAQIWPASIMLVLAILEVLAVSRGTP